MLILLVVICILVVILGYVGATLKCELDAKELRIEELESSNSKLEKEFEEIEKTCKNLKILLSHSRTITIEDLKDGGTFYLIEDTVKERCVVKLGPDAYRLYAHNPKTDTTFCSIPSEFKTKFKDRNCTCTLKEITQYINERNYLKVLPS